MLTNDNAESRRVVESCYKRTKVTINPIIDWEDSEVWSFIKANGIPYCELYDEGWERLGCIGCPMARKAGREQEFNRWPKYKAAYLRAFEKMLQARKAAGLEWNHIVGATAIDVFNWWMEYDVMPGQYNLFEQLEEEYDDDL